MGEDGCSKCFYWTKCPGDDTHGWCKKKKDFTHTFNICKQGLDKKTLQALC